jgi:uncharacterized protein
MPSVSLSHEEGWRNCEPCLWGIDLFNNGYYWEAHESWEAAWHATGRCGPMADFCKSLIKFAAAGVKAREGRANGDGGHPHAGSMASGMREIWNWVCQTIAQRSF